MFTGIVGFSRQMGADEARMLRLLDIHNQLTLRGDLNRRQSTQGGESRVQSLEIEL